MMSQLSQFNNKWKKKVIQIRDICKKVDFAAWTKEKSENLVKWEKYWPWKSQ